MDHACADEVMECVPDWKEVMRGEIKQMRADIQALKKTVTKGDKKAKKEVQGQIDEMEAQITSKQASISSDVNPNSKTDDNVVVTEQLYVEKTKGKRQERKEKKSTSQAAKAKALQDAKPKGPDYSAMEQRKLSELLGRAGLEIFDIEPDGHCMFQAVAHQLGLVDPTKSYTYGDIRGIAADYIKDNGAFYENFIDDEEDRDGNGAAVADSGIGAYSERIRSSTFWGGHLELDALSKALHFPIHVYQADSEEPLKFGSDDETIGKRPALNLCFQRYAYSLGEHYDSLVPFTPRQKSCE